MRTGTAITLAAIGVTLVAACNNESSKSTPTTSQPVAAVATDSQKASFVFERKPLREALPEIERRYNIRIDSIPNSLRNAFLTADFRGHSLAEALKTLEALFDVEMTPTGPNSYQMREKPSSSSS
jgi:ferric-dicitrate binding protein FerR (iron transport regulator)